MSFAGKTITMTIGFGAGGGVDLYGRMLGRHLTRYLPGHPGLIVLNQLGARVAWLPSTIGPIRRNPTACS
jgi:tripartite-type tricarboxylate transporter receptor subunit TctC